MGHPHAAHPFFSAGRPLLFGHRGASGELPENTLPAFERALAQGAMAIETDLRLTRDGEVVVFHDEDLDRTTDGHGPLAQRTLAELKRLDAGYRFTPDGGHSFPHRGAGFRIPTLREVFCALPGAFFNIEIKADDARLIESTLDLVGERTERTLLAAAEEATMRHLREALARRGLRPAVGASVADVLAFVRAALGLGPVPEEPMALQIPPDFGGKPLVTPRLLDFAHEQGVSVHVWTINDADEMRRLLALGVDGLMSDFPALLVRVARDAR